MIQTVKEALAQNVHHELHRLYLKFEFYLRYREQITNGFDLLSFMLITPEIMRFLGDHRIFIFRVYAIVSWSIAILSLSFGLYSLYEILGYGSYALKAYFGSLGFAPIIIVALSFVFVSLLLSWLSYLLWVTPDDPVTNASGSGYIRDSFYLGLVLFFVSRMLAFVAAFFPATERSP